MQTHIRWHFLEPITFKPCDSIHLSVAICKVRTFSTNYSNFHIHNVILGHLLEDVYMPSPWIPTVWHGDVVWCHKVTELKAGLLTRCFQVQGFLWELLLASTFLTLTFFCMHKNKYDTKKEWFDFMCLVTRYVEPVCLRHTESSKVTCMILKSHPHLTKNLLFGTATNLTYNPKASVPDKLVKSTFLTNRTFYLGVHVFGIKNVFPFLFQRLKLLIQNSLCVKYYQS